MRQTSILLCDDDAEYVNALVSYLMAWEAENNMNIVISHFSDGTAFEAATGAYDLAFLGAGYIKSLGSAPGRMRIKKLMCLSEDEPREGDGDFFYKYQSMDALIDVISTDKRQKALVAGRGRERVRRMTCIYSPGGNELTLTFALSICKLLSEKEEVIFVDIEDLSVLPGLIQAEYPEDMVDLIYLLENGMERRDHSGFVSRFEGFGVLAPPGAPTQLSYVTAQQWKSMYEYIYGQGYTHIVVLFGTLVQGFNETMQRSDHFVLVKSPGEFGGLMKEIFVKHLENEDMEKNYEEVELPFSAQNLTKGGYRLDALINGKMLDFTRKELGERLG